MMGCAQDRSDPAAPRIPKADQSTAIGRIHNELLERIHEIDKASLAKGKAVDAAELAASQIATEHGIAPLSPRRVREAIQWGAELAQQDPQELTSQLLPPSEREWWDRFFAEATPTTIRDVFSQQVRAHGRPTPGSTLANLVDIAISSAEYWYERRKDDVPIYNNPYVYRQQKGWRDRFKKWGRFAVAVTVDGVSGAITSSGGGPVAGAIVGGLASYGADCLVFGCN